MNALSAEPHPSPRVAGKAQPAHPPAAARERLVRARDLLRRGAVHESAEATGELQSQHPDNLLLRLLAAEVLREDGQEQYETEPVNSDKRTMYCCWEKR